MTSRILVGLLLVGLIAGAIWSFASRPDDVPVDVPLVTQEEVTAVSSPAVAVNEAAEELASPNDRRETVRDPSVARAERDDDQLVAFGRVFDSRGAPVEGAVVEGIATRAVPTEAGHRTLRLDAIADADGRYEMRSPTDVVDARLQARHRGFAESSIAGPLDPGRECDLTLTAAASLSGVVLAGTDVDLDQVSVSLKPDRATHRQKLVWISMVSDGRLDASGNYRFDGLIAGDYIVEVRSNEHFSWDALATTPLLTVPGGAVVVAPPIDLGTAVNTFHVEVVDEFGAPIPKGTGSYWESDIDDGSDILIADGSATIQTGHDAVVAWFGAPGRRTVQVPKLTGDMRVELPPAYTVRARLSDPRQIQHEPYVLWISAWSDLGQMNWPLGQLTNVSPVRFDAGGEATFEVTVARPLHFVLSVSDSRMEKDGRSVRQGVNHDRLLIPIHDQRDEQVIEINIDSKALDEALELLGL